MLRFLSENGVLLQIGPLSMIAEWTDKDGDLCTTQFQYTDRERKQFTDWLYEYATHDDLYLMGDFDVEVTKPAWFAACSSDYSIILQGTSLSDKRNVVLLLSQREASNLANAINQGLLFTPDEYQRATSETATYHDNPAAPLLYLGLGLTGEAGEVADVIKKLYRDAKGNIDSTFIDQIEKECGDAMWYLAQLLLQCNLSLEQVMRTNLLKLKSRKERGVIGGSGDIR